MRYHPCWFKWLGIAALVSGLTTQAATSEQPFPTPEGAALHAALAQEVGTAGKSAWRPVLSYLARLHGLSVRPATGYFKHAYESLGPGYMRGRAFGHWDLTHERLDTLRASPEHVRNQIHNELAGQQADGLIPGLVTFGISGHPGFETIIESDQPTFKPFKGFPPLWVIAVEAYVEKTGDVGVLGEALGALKKQIGWFEAKRSAPNGGFYYLDVVSDVWESGVDEGIRFINRPPAPAACVDATAHVYLMYDHAARWSEKLRQPADVWKTRAAALQRFISEELWDEQSGFFYDRWSVRDPATRHLSFEGMWPVVVGAASPEQARRVIEEHLLNSREFFTPHPLTTVALSDAKFELRMWRGPVWNSMTYWAARGCVRYGHREAARKLLESALDATAAEFARSGTIWEFYHPMREEPSALKRKTSGRDVPCRDYVGHNPLFAMAALWRETAAKP
ncbi:MAG: trehalase family glycosidase [Lacunisphaera sp.]|nr:trehalase family glycosidase [Lacunisphaera sp.]